MTPKDQAEMEKIYQRQRLDRITERLLDFLDAFADGRAGIRVEPINPGRHLHENGRLAAGFTIRLDKPERRDRDQPDMFGADEAPDETV